MNETKRRRPEMNEEVNKIWEEIVLEKKSHEEFERKLKEKLDKMLKEINEKLEKKFLVKERLLKYEILDARKTLIKKLGDLSGEHRSTIGIKEMGEINAKPFMSACVERFNGDNFVLAQFAKIYSNWRNNLKDRTWNPFKHVVAFGRTKKVVDERDVKLVKLKQEWGIDVKNAVKTALMEQIEFNPNGRCSVRELWNFELGRRATLKEGIEYITKQPKPLKRQRTSRGSRVMDEGFLNRFLCNR